MFPSDLSVLILNIKFPLGPIYHEEFYVHSLLKNNLEAVELFFNFLLRKKRSNYCMLSSG